MSWPKEHAVSLPPGARTRSPAVTSCATPMAKLWPTFIPARDTEALQAKMLTKDEAHRTAAGASGEGWAGVDFTGSTSRNISEATSLPYRHRDHLSLDRTDRRSARPVGRRPPTVPEIGVWPGVGCSAPVVAPQLLSHKRLSWAPRRRIGGYGRQYAAFPRGYRPAIAPFSSTGRRGTFAAVGRLSWRTPLNMEGAGLTPERSITNTAVFTALAPNRFKDFWRD